jgi:HSP20 family protein
VQDELFRGLGNLLRIATELAEQAQGGQSQAEVRRSGSCGIPKTLHAVYGVSVRVGPRGEPVVAPFGNVRRNARKEAVVEEAREPLADVLDEDDHFLVVVELPGVDESAVHWELGDGVHLTVSASARGRAYSRAIELTEPADPARALARYENGVLELRLAKEGR